jgi:hypothetical protein
MLGGSFLPGIEVGREAGIATNWCLFHGGTIHFPDVRFKPCDDAREHTVGTLTKDLSVPWTADFLSCDETFWPTGRPGKVYVNETVRRDWMLQPAVRGDPIAANNHPGDVIPHLNSDATASEYYKEYWKSLGFVRRTATDKFIVAE